MHAHQKASAEAHLATLPGLFETLYVRKGKADKDVIATYAVTVEDRLVYYKSVSILTGLCTDEGYDFAGPYVTYGSTVQALGEHYNDAYVRGDGLVLMQELCADRCEYPANALPTHAVFGQGVYYADVDELHLEGGDVINLLDARAARLV